MQSDEVGHQVAQDLEDMPLRRIVDHTNQAEMHGTAAGSPTMEYVLTNKMVKKLPKEEVKKRFTEGFAQIYDEWDAQLSSSEREAFAYDPTAGALSFRKFLNRLDEGQFRAKLLKKADK